MITERLRWSHPNKRRYGAIESYQIAARWLAGCADVADWGAGGGYFRSFLPASVRYVAIDGTPQIGVDVVADLSTYATRSDGILLRHVIDNTPDWRPVLRQAVRAFRWRLVVVTYTPDAPTSQIVRHEDGWPVWSLNPDDVRAVLQPCGVCEILTAAAPERVYLVERLS